MASTRRDETKAHPPSIRRNGPRDGSRGPNPRQTAGNDELRDYGGWAAEGKKAATDDALSCTLRLPHGKAVAAGSRAGDRCRASANMTELAKREVPPRSAFVHSAIHTSHDRGPQNVENTFDPVLRWRGRRRPMESPKPQRQVRFLGPPLWHGRAVGLRLYSEYEDCRLDSRRSLPQGRRAGGPHGQEP
jgi:hypothetical protein